MNYWQRINIVNLPNLPLESQKINDEVFNIYDKLNYLRTLGLNQDKPRFPIEGELYNDGEKINVYLGPGLGPEGDGFVPVAYIDPDNRYAQLVVFQQFTSQVSSFMTSVNSSLVTISTTISSLSSRVGTIETVNIPTINNRLDTHDTTLATHASMINSVSITANSAYNTALTANTTANTALTTANNAQNAANAAQTTANTALSTANNALSTANTALSTANSALSLARRRGYKVLLTGNLTNTNFTIYQSFNVSSITVEQASTYTFLSIYYVSTTSDYPVGLVEILYSNLNVIISKWLYTYNNRAHLYLKMVSCTSTGFTFSAVSNCSLSLVVFDTSTPSW